MVQIAPDRLTEIRRLRGVGRPKLAKLSGLTERQLARLEGAIPSDAEPTEEMLDRLSHALRVSRDAFAGDRPLTDDDFDFTPGKSCSCC